MSRRTMAPPLVWLLLVPVVLAAPATMWLSIRSWQVVGLEPDIAVFAPIPLTVTVGLGILVVVRARNLTGWLLALVGGLLLLGVFLHEYAFYGLVTAPGALPGVSAAAWLNAWVVLPGIFAIPALFLLFPTGRPPSRRWRPLLWGLVGAAVLMTVANAVLPGPLQGEFNDFGVVLDNPLGIPVERDVVSAVIAASGGVLAIIGLASVAALVIRLRGAKGQERQQIKLLAYVATVATTLLVVSSIIEAITGESEADRCPSIVCLSEALWVLGLFGFIAALPVTIGMAILRYGLYRIDVVVQLTLVYGALTVTLAGTYFGVVVGLQAAFRSVTGQQSDIAIVISTLAIFALSVPLRRRIRDIIDKRFYRRRYDAAQTLAAFIARLRDEVDVDRLTGELVAVVEGTMQPTHTSLWLREGYRNASRNDPETIVH